MNAGAYFWSIEIFKPKPVINEYGETTEEWNYEEPDITTRAKLSKLNQSRVNDNGDITYLSGSRQVWIRKYHKVDVYDRLRVQGKLYQITDIALDDILQSLVLEIELIND